MSDEEIEKQAVETAQRISKPCLHITCNQYCSMVKQAFKDGAKWGMEHQWHDLRKNPNDLPKEEKEVLVYLWRNYYIGSYSSEDKEWWFDEFSLENERLDEVIAWCELPTYKE